MSKKKKETEIEIIALKSKHMVEGKKYVVGVELAETLIKQKRAKKA